MQKWLLVALFLGVAGVANATDNNNAQAILFTNGVARPMADQIGKMYYACKLMNNVWSAQNLGAIIPGDSNLIDDGATCDASNPSCKPDGRNPVQNGDIQQMNIQCAALVSGLEANNSANLTAILKVAVNP